MIPSYDSYTRRRAHGRQRGERRAYHEKNRAARVHAFVEKRFDDGEITPVRVKWAARLPGWYLRRVVG